MMIFEKKYVVKATSSFNTNLLSASLDLFVTSINLSFECVSINFYTT